ncbi:MAG TPA: flagellar hook-length control protein FliK, partial [Steroidobacteraceae bacterium]|nr:flagellar hook-length control protein FliK [Steroidobacteraceae bacterium]
PAETVGRFPASPQSPAFPVLPASRAGVAGVEADARGAQPDLAAAYRATPSAVRPSTPLMAPPADAAVAALGDSIQSAEAAIRLATPADAAPSSPAYAAASPAAAQPAPSPQAAAPAAAATPMDLPERVGSDDWNEAVAQRLGQLVESPHARASLRLNPPQLGPLQVEVHVDGDRAVVSFAVHHDATRDALEQAMPRVRAQLEGSGFASIDVGVSHNPHRERRGAGEAYLQPAFLADEDLAAAVAPRPAAAASSRLLDAYA